MRRPTKANSIKPHHVLFGQLLPLALARIFTCMPRLGTELGEGFVLGNRHVGTAMRLLVPLQVLHSIIECLMFALRLGACSSCFFFLLPSLLLLLLLSLPSLMLCLLLLILLLLLLMRFLKFP